MFNNMNVFGVCKLDVCCTSFIPFVTTRIRNMMGGYVFSGVCLLNIVGGLPHLHPIILPLQWQI